MSKRQEQYYEKIVRTYSLDVRLIFLCQVAYRKPYIEINRETVAFHNKNIMLYFVLQRVHVNLRVWPPRRINAIIEESVSDYINTLP